MYYELSSFLKHVGSHKAIWKDGEFITAVLGGIASGVWFHYSPDIIKGIQNHFDDLLQFTSIIFGFVLTALFFHIEAAGSWKSDPRIERVTSKLVTYHVWTIICLLFLAGYILLLWGIEGEKKLEPFFLKYSFVNVFAFSFLSFLIMYCGFQILNQALTVHWAFSRRDVLEKEKRSPREIVNRSETVPTRDR